MNYDLNSLAASKKSNTAGALRKLMRWLGEERRVLIYAFLVMLVTSGINLTGPLLIGRAIDKYIAKGDYPGALYTCLLLVLLYLVSFGSNYFQTILMGGLGQRLRQSWRGFRKPVVSSEAAAKG